MLTLCRKATGATSLYHWLVALPHLDTQLAEIRPQIDAIPGLPEVVRDHLASTIYDEVAALPEQDLNRIRASTPIAPEQYREEMEAFQQWNQIALSNAGNPVVVRAHVVTGLYVSFVWLRDSILKPVVEHLPQQSCLHAVTTFLSTGDRRRLRNAVAHGRWTYLPDFDGLECWDGRPPTRFDVRSQDHEAWQLLSRGCTIAVLLALTDDG